MTSVVVSPVSANILAARYEKGQIAIWDMSTPKAAPLKVMCIFIISCMHGVYVFSISCKSIECMHLCRFFPTC